MLVDLACDSNFLAYLCIFSLRKAQTDWFSDKNGDCWIAWVSMNKKQQAELTDIVDGYCTQDGFTETLIPSLRLYRMAKPNGKMPVIYNSSLCIVVQGKKRAILKEDIFYYSESEFLVASVDLPATGEVLEATSSRPYFGLQLHLDLRLLNELIAQMGWQGLKASPTERGFFVWRSDEDSVDCILRLIRLLKKPADIPFLAPLLLREIHYRLLSSEHGQRIAQVVLPDSSMQRISHVIGVLQKDFSKSLRVEDLADMAHMSLSSFHLHFKEVTSMSPLQFQKQLRLLEARRVMLAENKDAATAAYEVGYESPSQFSREYSRMFGAPPMSDIAVLRKDHGAASIVLSSNKATA